MLTMATFDWRRFEPATELRKDHWPEMLSDDPFSRYDEFFSDPRRQNPWRDLLGAVFEMRSREPTPDVQRQCVVELDTFLKAIGKLNLKPIACVFISHQRKDTGKGERIACLAEHHALSCWLDVLDPNLARVNALPPNDPRRSVLIAATIEIALLSCTHVIAVHTDNSLVSRWVPYELGRAKARQVAALNAAGWLAARQDASTCGDYVQLAVMTRDEPAVARWLVDAGGKPNNVPVNADCDPHKTEVLT
jgi:hypothetical protein